MLELVGSMSTGREQVDCLCKLPKAIHLGVNTPIPPPLDFPSIVLWHQIGALRVFDCTT